MKSIKNPARGNRSGASKIHSFESECVCNHGATNLLTKTDLEQLLPHIFLILYYQTELDAYLERNRIQEVQDV
jgi:hypothetical protein